MKERKVGTGESRRSEVRANKDENRDRGVNPRSAFLLVEECRHRVLNLCKSAQRALLPLRCSCIILWRRIGGPRFFRGLNSLRGRMYEWNYSTCATEGNPCTRLVRLGFLLSGATAGFFYAAQSGQLPLLLPDSTRLHAPEDHPSFHNFSPVQSGVHSAVPHTPRTLDVAPVWEKFAPFHSVSRARKPPQTDANQQEREPHTILSQEIERRPLQSLSPPQSYHRLLKTGRQVYINPNTLQEHKHGPPEVDKLQQSSCKRPERDTKAGGLWESSVVSLADTAFNTVDEAAFEISSGSSCAASESVAATDFGSEENNFINGKEGGGGGQKNQASFVDSFSAVIAYVSTLLRACGSAPAAVIFPWETTTSLWILVILFSVIPTEERWPPKARRGSASEEAEQLATTQYSGGGGTKLPLGLCTREKIEQTQVSRDLAPQYELLECARLQEHPSQQKQRDHRHWVFGRWQALKTSRLRVSILKRGEPVEVVMQCVVLTVLGFFSSFFLAKTFFGCESISRQMEAQFIVLLLIPHLQEYLFYFWFHPEKLSVDRFIFSNTCLYAVVVALSVVELRLKPHEFAAGGTLGHIVTHVRPMQQWHSEHAFSLVRTHQRLLSKQQRLLNSTESVNMLMLQLSWIGHFVRAATKVFGNNSSYRSNGSSSQGCNSSCLIVEGKHPEAPAGGSPCFPIGATQLETANANPKAAHRGRHCICNWVAACELWQCPCCEGVAEQQADVPHKKNSRVSSSQVKCEGKRHSQCCGVLSSTSSASPDNNAEDDGKAGMAQRSSGSDLHAPGASHSRCNARADAAGDGGENFTVASCWELSVLLCCRILGAVTAVAGLVLRALAQVTAGRNFTHKIACDRDPERVLTARGVYAFMRHPGYAGSFYWAVGVQLMMCNVVMLLFSIRALRTFYSYRIAFEERMLNRVFPDGVYAAYRAKTPSIGVPFLDHEVLRVQQEMASATNTPADDGSARSIQQIS